MQDTIIIIPCYNESKRFDTKEFVEFCNENNNTHLLFVNDGSSDNTLLLLKELQSNYIEHISILSYDKNKGKAEAIRTGVKYCLEGFTFNHIGYFDADLSTPLANIPGFTSLLERSNKIELVAGSRIKRMGAVIKRKRIRHFLGRVFASLASILLHLPIYDTQCGAKLMTRQTASLVFNEPFHSKWLFDVEVFARIILYRGYIKAIGSVVEIPLECWKNKEKSKITLSDIILLPFDLVKLYFLYFKKIKRIKKLSVELSEIDTVE